MSVMVRARRLVNPSVKRRRKPASTKTRNNPTRRKLSAKQINFFGTARQKAALKAKRNPSTRNRKIKRASKARNYTKAEHYAGRSNVRLQKRKRRANVGEIVSIALAGLNPGVKRRKNGMAKRRKARKNYGTVVGRSFSHTKTSKRRKAKKNPGTRRRRASATHTKRRRSVRRNPMFRVRRVRRHARRNPGILTGVLGKAVGIIGGAVATRYATQLVLGGKNMGVMGYLGNAVMAFGLGWGVGKVAGKEMGTNVMIGGAVSTLLRFITDNTSFGKYVNLSLAGAGKGGDIGMGIIQDSSFFLPSANEPGSMTTFATPRNTSMAINSSANAMAAMRAKSAGVGTVFGRRKASVV